jgi:hypothetical protein
MIINLCYESYETNSNLLGFSEKTPSGNPITHASPLVTLMQAISDLKGYNNYYHPREIIFNKITPENTDSVDKYIIPIGVSHGPDDWAKPELFSNLPEVYLKDLRNKKAMLVIDQSLEGYHQDYIWEFFHSQCSLYELNPRCIFYVTGNMMTGLHYHVWCDSRNISYDSRIRAIGYPHFEHVVYYDSIKRNQSDTPLPTFEKHVSYKKEHVENIKTFACLNKRQRQHRVWMFVRLLEEQLLDSGLVSMNDYGRHVRSWEGKELTREQIEKSSEILPKLVYEKSNNELNDLHYIHRFNDDVCLDTFFSIVPEAACGDKEKSVFLSEKTFKPICCSTPFAIWGGKYSLKELKKLGYKTFHPFIDESYDTMDTWDRLEALIKNTKKIDSIKNKFEWFEGMQDILEHNLKQIEINTIRKEPPAFLELERYYIQYFG